MAQKSFTQKKSSAKEGDTGLSGSTEPGNIFEWDPTKLPTGLAAQASHQTQSLQASIKDQKQAVMLQEQIESLRASQNIDANIWRHFQNLLKKNLHNPYLREALLKKASLQARTHLSMNQNEAS